ncbi:MAG: hypothetical protein ACR2IE_15765 [Candidatus Sumerlaeaceae bacterium]
MRLISPLSRGITALLAVSVITAAASAAPRAQQRVTADANCQSAVVLDFSVAPRAVPKRDCCTRRIGYTEKELVTEKDYRGWWLGHQDIFLNSNVGRMAADIFSDYLRDNGMYAITSREDLKYYYADKRELIGTKLNLKGDALEKALLQLDPVQIGKEMGVDKVVVGHICDSELRKPLVPGSFASAVSMNVAIFDVATGTLEFDKCYMDIDNHTTQFFHYERLAEEFGADLQKLRRGSLRAPWFRR